MYLKYHQLLEDFVPRSLARLRHPDPTGGKVPQTPVWTVESKNSFN